MFVLVIVVCADEFAVDGARAFGFWLVFGFVSVCVVCVLVFTFVVVCWLLFVACV